MAVTEKKKSDPGGYQQDFSDVDVSEILYSVLTEFSERIDERLIRNLEKKKINKTGETIKSLKSFVTKGILSNFHLEFQTHARILEIQRRDPRSFQDPNALALWVLKNIDDFEYNGKPARGQKGSALRIGFAIAKTKQRLGKRKLRSWYSASIQNLIYGENGLIDRLMTELTDDMINRLSQINNK